MLYWHYLVHVSAKHKHCHIQIYTRHALLVCLLQLRTVLVALYVNAAQTSRSALFLMVPHPDPFLLPGKEALPAQVQVYW